MKPTLRNGAIVSLSGGLDSTTVLAWAVNAFGPGNVVAVGYDYGQKHRLELEQAILVAKWFRVPFQVIQLPKIFAGAGSSLVDEEVSIEDSVGSYTELSAREGSQPTVVPNRNMNFIAMSTTLAWTSGVNRVLLGVHASDAANFHYPDCRGAFTGAMAAAIEIASEGTISLEAPFNYMSKADIIREAAKLRAPLHLTQSCYQGKRPACGVCATCVERIESFKDAGYIDPIQYEIDIDWGNAQPWSALFDSHQYIETPAGFYK